MSSPTQKRAASSPRAGDETRSKRQKTDSEQAIEQVEPAEVQQMAEDPQSEELPANGAGPEAETRKGKAKRPATKDLFTPFKPTIEVPDTADPSWGIVPYPSGEPEAHPDSPPAKTSDAATSVPLWEDRKFKFKQGQHHKYFGNYAENEDGPDLDQNDNLMMTLMDMRPISKKNQEPRRRPTTYIMEHGKPKDWNDARTIKLLNDRRRDAVNRITCDPPFTETEREYLAELIQEHPNASITELTERFNYRFKGDFVEKVGFGFEEQHPGRTIESVRYEYLSWKQTYDKGEVPRPKRAPGDVTAKQKKVNKLAEEHVAKFGPQEEDLSSDEPTPSDVEDDATEKSKPKAKSPNVKGKATAKTTKVTKAKVTKATKVTRKTKKATKAELSKKLIVDSDEEADSPKLAPEEEDLLDLAGYNNPSQVRSSSPLDQNKQNDAADFLEGEVEIAVPVTRSWTPSTSLNRKRSAASEKPVSRKSSRTAPSATEKTTEKPESRKSSTTAAMVPEIVADQLAPRKSSGAGQVGTENIAEQSKSRKSSTAEPTVTVNAADPPIRASSPPVQIPGLTLIRPEDTIEPTTEPTPEAPEQLATPVNSRIRQLSSEEQYVSENVDTHYPHPVAGEPEDKEISALSIDAAVEVDVTEALDAPLLFRV
ncbi:hypothetical protein P154DRAFT_561125 [Amniculicola lignicola CBS 123094]|uniref:Myb-like domain-containing protein n=1 Tax=Amniculicola lignicola CBS 123094 TaxID=1392246 RepID=A0A6A5WPQ0_9PLEO|nr:hypothetical protein P154DRAFT_561125 [Amniculicola lignicola CBS 123094]